MTSSSELYATPVDSDSSIASKTFSHQFMGGERLGSGVIGGAGVGFPSAPTLVGAGLGLWDHWKSGSLPPRMEASREQGACLFLPSWPSTTGPGPEQGLNEHICSGRMN